MGSAIKIFIRTGLDARRRARRRQQIAAYARQVAGSREDLDPDLERAALELWRL